jgi:hypothetical protein
MDIVRKNQHSVQCEVLTDSGQTVEDSCEQTLEDSNIHNDKEPTDDTVRGTERSGQTVEDSKGHSE